MNKEKLMTWLEEYLKDRGVDLHYDDWNEIYRMIVFFIDFENKIKDKDSQRDEIIKLGKTDVTVASCLSSHNVPEYTTWESMLSTMVILLQEQKDFYMKECIRLKSYKPIVIRMNTKDMDANDLAKLMESKDK